MQFWVFLFVFQVFYNYLGSIKFKVVNVKYTYKFTPFAHESNISLCQYNKIWVISCFFYSISSLATDLYYTSNDYHTILKLATNTGHIIDTNTKISLKVTIFPSVFTLSTSSSTQFLLLFFFLYTYSLLYLFGYIQVNIIFIHKCLKSWRWLVFCY